MALEFAVVVLEKILGLGFVVAPSHLGHLNRHLWGFKPSKPARMQPNNWGSNVPWPKKKVINGEGLKDLTFMN